MIQKLAVDYAAKVDRQGEADKLDGEDSEGLGLSDEDHAVGLRVTAWLRQRLPSDDRAGVYEAVRRLLARQLAEGARHVRRLHMAMVAVDTMGITSSEGDEHEPGEDHTEAREDSAKALLDDLTLWMVHGMRAKRNIMDMLGCQGVPGGSSSSLATPPSTTLAECQRLRLWLNEYFEYEGEVADLLCMQPEQGPEELDGYQEPCLDPVLEEETREAELDSEGDQHSLMERPPWERRWWEKSRSRSRGRRGGGKARGRGRSRARSPEPERPQRTRRGQEGAGGEGRRPDGRHTSGTPGPSTRARTAATASAGAPRAPRLNFDPAAARELPETFRQHAWHCLLEMSNATQNPERWSYGVTANAQQNINATFADISDRERGTMLVEFLRVISRTKRVVGCGTGRSGRRTQLKWHWR